MSILSKKDEITVHKGFFRFGCEVNKHVNPFLFVWSFFYCYLGPVLDNFSPNKKLAVKISLDRLYVVTPMKYSSKCN